jgi:hypothetical protein
VDVRDMYDIFKSTTAVLGNLSSAWQASHGLSIFCPSSIIMYLRNQISQGQKEHG